MTLNEARDHIGARVVFHPPSYSLGQVEEGVIIRVVDPYDGPYAIVQYAGQLHHRAAHVDHLTLMRGGSLSEHVRLNQLDAGFPMTEAEEG